VTLEHGDDIVSLVRVVAVLNAMVQVYKREQDSLVRVSTISMRIRRFVWSGGASTYGAGVVKSDNEERLVEVTDDLIRADERKGWDVR